MSAIKRRGAPLKPEDLSEHDCLSYSYVDVPDEIKDTTTKSGWIKFGEPRYPVPGLQPERFIQPRPGRLVLFPSYMWHGTNAIFGDDPRLAIAFDIKPG